MLKYGLTDRFVRQLLRLSFDERMDVLWKILGFLSHVPGYLKLKDDGSEERPIFKNKGSFIFMRDDYDSRILLDIAPKKEDLQEGNIVYKETIVNLLAKKDLDEVVNKPLRIAIDNHFPTWFINLLALLPNEDLNALMSKDVIEEKHAEQEEQKEIKIAEAPKLEPDAQIEREEKEEIDPLKGAKFEREILRELAKVYKERKKKQKVQPNKPLGHVKFSNHEVIIEYQNLGECLFLAKKRTQKFGCKLDRNDWKLLLTNTVDEETAAQLERRYKGHVCYTDEPNKGELRIAFIVKPKKHIEHKDEYAVKRVKSKTASFQNEMPSGAFENIDEEEEIIFHNSSFKPMVQKNVVHISNDVKIEQVEEQMEDFLEDDFFGEDFDFISAENPSIPADIEEVPIYPAHWHCHICGKKKLYSGEPAESVKLASGKIVYLCNKHRGKL